ncbi:hypothetical protein GD1_165 [Paraglaciecola Antarctic GD virus 1]|nr:hypothetical protein GD1_165 [Paraglaciecola Antarctic GD virus 1]
MQTRYRREKRLFRKEVFILQIGARVKEHLRTYTVWRDADDIDINTVDRTFKHMFSDFKKP